LYTEKEDSMLLPGRTHAYISLLEMKEYADNLGICYDKANVFDIISEIGQRPEFNGGGALEEKELELVTLLEMRLGPLVLQELIRQATSKVSHRALVDRSLVAILHADEGMPVLALLLAESEEE
jgi:hypothetical protein